MTPEKNNLITVSGRNWSSLDTNTFTVSPFIHLNVYELLKRGVLQSLKKCNVTVKEGYEEQAIKHVLRHIECKLNGEIVPEYQWKSTFPNSGDYLEFLVAPKGGGGNGGKQILSAVLMIAVMVAAIASQQYYLATFGTQTVTGVTAAGQAVIGYTTGSLIASYAVGMAVMAAGTMLVNALTPTPKMSGMSDGQAETSQVYSVGGTSNRINPLGYVPLVLGKFRYHAPLGAKTFSKYIENQQYYYLLPVWGHCDCEIFDIRVGETRLIDYGALNLKSESSSNTGYATVYSYGNDVEKPVIQHHLIYNNLNGDPQNGFVYFSEIYNEQSVGVLLKKKNGWVTRNLGDCDAIKLDFSWAAFCEASKKDGSTNWCTVNFQAQYRDLGDPSGSWLNFESNVKSVRETTAFNAVEQLCGETSGGILAWINNRGEYHVCSAGSNVVIKKSGNYYTITYQVHTVAYTDKWWDQGWSSPKTETVVYWVRGPNGEKSEYVELLGDFTFDERIEVEEWEDAEDYGGE